MNYTAEYLIKYLRIVDNLVAGVFSYKEAGTQLENLNKEYPEYTLSIPQRTGLIVDNYISYDGDDDGWVHSQVC